MFYSFAERRVLSATLLLVVTIGTFYPVLFNGFVYDDHFQLVANPYVKDLRYVRTLFATDVWHFSPATRSNNYRPLHMLAYLVLYKCFGLNPFVFHLTNLFLHLCCVFLIWRIAQQYLEETPAFLSALLFGTHPVHVEPIAWIGGTPDLLHGVFLLSAFLLYLRGAVLVSLIPFAAALWSKEPALVFPAVVVIDHCLFRRSQLRSFLFWLCGSIMVVLLYLCARVYALGSFLRLNEVRLDIADQLYTAVSFTGFYLNKLILPVDLRTFYHFRLPLDWETSWIALLTLVGGLSFLFLARRNRTTVLGGLWFAVMIIPCLFASGVSPVLFAERYAYVPSAGFFLALAALPLKRAGYVLLLCLGVVFALISFPRSEIWKDDVTLWTAAVSDAPPSVTANYNLATAYLKLKKWQQAADFYRRTISLNPEIAEAYYNLASCNFSLKKYSDSAENLRLFLNHWKGDDRRRREAVQKLEQLERLQQ